MISFIHMGDVSLPCCGKDYNVNTRLSDLYFLWKKYHNRSSGKGQCRYCSQRVKVNVDGYSMWVSIE